MFTGPFGVYYRTDIYGRQSDSVREIRALLYLRHRNNTPSHSLEIQRLRTAGLFA